MNTNGGKTLKQRLILWSNRLRFDINVQRKGRFAQVIFPERFKSFVRTIKIVLTLIGLTSAFFFFQSIFVSFLFGLGIYLLITAFDKLVFSYNSLYVHLLPDFEIEPEKWLGAFFWVCQRSEKYRPHPDGRFGHVRTRECKKGSLASSSMVIWKTKRRGKQYLRKRNS